MFCKYKNALGKVKEGLHSYRIFDIAIIDVLLSVLVAYIIHYIFPKYKFPVVLLVIFLLGIVAHRLFCVRTTIDKLLFPD